MASPAAELEAHDDATTETKSPHHRPLRTIRLGFRAQHAAVNDLSHFGHCWLNMTAMLVQFRQSCLVLAAMSAVLESVKLFDAAFGHFLLSIY